MSPLGGSSLSNPVDQTWHSLREAVLAHPRVSGARFDHDIKRVDLMTEKSLVGPRRRLSAMVAVDADGTRVVIAGAGNRGPTQQIAAELLADVNRRLGYTPTEEASRQTLPPLAPFDKLPEPTVDDAREPQPSRSERAPRTPPAPPPPPAPTAPTSPPPPPSARRTAPSRDALSELALGNDWG
jgi:hypothetical protein